jgi:hypothetical protein
MKALARVLQHYYAKVSGEIINTFSITLWPLKLSWSSTSLWKTNTVLHSRHIHIAFKSSGCICVCIYPSPLQKKQLCYYMNWSMILMVFVQIYFTLTLRIKCYRWLCDKYLQKGLINCGNGFDSSYLFFSLQNLFCPRSINSKSIRKNIQDRCQVSRS